MYAFMGSRCLRLCTWIVTLVDLNLLVRMTMILKQLDGVEHVATNTLKLHSETFYSEL